MMVPSIHENGTSRHELMTQVFKARRALQVALDAMGEMTPNGRDYYVQGPGATSVAIAEHYARIAKVKDVYDTIGELGEAIYGAPGRR